MLKFRDVVMPLIQSEIDVNAVNDKHSLLNTIVESFKVKRRLVQKLSNLNQFKVNGGDDANDVAGDDNSIMKLLILMLQV